MLRPKRKRISIVKNITVYRIFDKKTLLEMSEIIPETEDQMRYMKSVGQARMQMYGTY